MTILYAQKDRQASHDAIKHMITSDIISEEF